jgi:trehalose 6-phosphate synthase/phosphatase
MKTTQNPSKAVAKVTDRMEPYSGAESSGRQSGSGLILVSNRQPYEHIVRKGHRICQRTDGGLTFALDPILTRCGGVWIAWGNGDADRSAVGPDGTTAVPPESPAYSLRRVWLTPEEIKGGYHGYANEVLWPLCHITLDRVAYRRRYWMEYVELNRRFAESVIEELKIEHRLVWVHDFHLALLPRFIKELQPATSLAFFWHIPWPGIDVFRVLPEARDLLQSLLAADSLVFQTAGYARAFAECARFFLGAEIDEARHTVLLKGHSTHLTAQAISVDVGTFSRQARAPQVDRMMASIRRQVGGYSGMKYGLGVDRLDYTKGLLKRFWAIDQFFSRYPEYCGRFTFVQIAIPTRKDVEAYRRYRKVIWQTVLDINDRHRSADAELPEKWQPILYLEERIPFDLLASYYRLADVAVVSSVNDGMNLVAKEYVASQVDESGVLLISQMAGAAEELTDALIINPYDAEGVADSIRQALEMPIDERRRRMRAMRAYLQAHDLRAWAEACLRDAGVSMDRLLGMEANALG